MTHRTRTEIYHAILSFCSVSRRKTEIVYGCNLNFKIINPHLEKLIKRGLIIQHDELYYKTTDDGDKVVDLMTPTVQLIREMEMG